MRPGDLTQETPVFTKNKRILKDHPAICGYNEIARGIHFPRDGLLILSIPGCSPSFGRYWENLRNFSDRVVSPHPRPKDV
jgi:hypothetical protein